MLTVDFDCLKVKKNDLMLDAGCGEGRHAYECISRGARVLCMDMDYKSLNKAKWALNNFISKDNYEGAAFMVHMGDALNLPFRDETFDSIICSEVMEHVSDDNKACSELVRVLKSGGTIAITVPTYFSELIYDIITFEYFTSPGGHVRKYFPKKLAEIMRRNGLSIYDVKFKHSFHTIYWLIRCVVGLHLENHPITRSYRSFLTRGLFSPLMRRLEGLFDNIFPKSIILYAVKITRE